MKTSLHTNLTTLELELNRAAIVHYSFYSKNEISLMELDLTRKEIKYITKNLSFFNNDLYFINSTNLVIKISHQKMQSKIKDFFLEEVIKIIKPTKREYDNFAKNFISRFITHTAYSVSEFELLNQLSQELCFNANTYSIPSFEELPLLLQIKYFAHCIISSNLCHSIKNMLSDLACRKLPPNTNIDSYFNDLNYALNFFSFISKSYLPSIVSISNGSIYINDEFFKNDKIILFYLAPLLDLGCLHKANIYFLTYSTLSKLNQH